MNYFSAALVPFCIYASNTAQAVVRFPWKYPGQARVEASESSATLSNRMFSASFRKAGKGMVFGGMKMSNGNF